MSEWISVKDELPLVDYDNKKSARAVRVKLNDNEDFVVNCLYRDCFSFHDGFAKRSGYLFYDLEKNRIYGGVTHWMSLPEPPPKKRGKKCPKA